MIIIAKQVKKDSQARSYQITQNNPSKYNITRESFKETILKFKPIYYCISEEIGIKEKTPHYHAYFKCSSPVRFSTCKKRFKYAHIEQALGSATDNRNYLMKTDKYIDKNETLIDFEEAGEIPQTTKEKRLSEKAEVLQKIKDGKTNLEIIEENENLLFHLKDIENIRQEYLKEKYSTEFRDVCCTFIYGATETYKTTFVYSHYNAKDIFRIYNYQNLNSLWDGYTGQPVILFDEFKGQIPIELMLILTDRFPVLNLNARYNNKIAMYSQVYFCTNENFDKIYAYEKVMHPATYKAWERRIHNIYEFRKNPDGSPNIIVHKDTKKIIYKDTKKEEISNERTEETKEKI